MNVPCLRQYFWGKLCILVAFNILLRLGLPEVRDYILHTFRFSPSMYPLLGTGQAIDKHLSKTAAEVPPSTYVL